MSRVRSLHSNSRNFFHWAFDLGVIFKGINGVIEVLAGIALLCVDPASILYGMSFLSRDERSGNLESVIARALLHLAQDLTSSAKIFAAVYLLSHGIIKIGLVIALLKKKLWAYPLAIVVFMCFIVYQAYRIYERYTTGMMLLTFVDLIVLFLVWSEYRFITLGSHSRTSVLK